MNADEKTLIENLAQRLRNADLSDIDTEAEKLIQKLMSNQPRAMYLLTQAVLLQEQALKASQAKIKQLEQDHQESRHKKSSFLGGLFGSSKQSHSHQQPSYQNGMGGVPNSSAQANYSQSRGGNYSQPQGGNYYQPSRSSSFMGQAASTALGVAGGALLFEGVSHMMGGNGFLGGGHETIVDETIVNESPDLGANDGSGWGANDSNDPFANNNDAGFDSFSGDSNNDFTNSSFGGFSDNSAGFGNDNSGFDSSDFDAGGFDSGDDGGW